MFTTSSTIIPRIIRPQKCPQRNFFLASPCAYSSRSHPNNNGAAHKSRIIERSHSEIIPPLIPPAEKSPRTAASANTNTTTAQTRSTKNNSTILSSKKIKSNLTAPAARRVVKSLLPSTTERHGKAIAFATAAEYDLDLLRIKLEQYGYPVRTLMEEAVLYIPQYPLQHKSQTNNNNSGEIFIFENGSYVTWGIHESLAKQFLNDVIRDSNNNNNTTSSSSSTSIEQGPYHEMQSEFLHYHVQPESSTRVSSDVIFIGSSDSSSSSSSSSASSSQSAQSPEPSKSHSDSSSDSSITTFLPPPLPTSSVDLDVRLSLSYGFTRSTKLAVYEESMVSFLEAAEEIPNQLIAGSEAPVRKSVIIRRLGELVKWRQHLNLVEPNLLDSPEFLWTNASLESYYVSICRALEVDSRLRTLNKKIDIAREELSMLMDLLSNQTSHRLEWIIILLIFVEIMLVLLREGLPFTNSHKKVDKNTFLTSAT